MATVPATRVWTAGEVVLDSYMNNNVSAVLNFLLAKPTFLGLQTVAQSIANNSDVAINFDTESVDSAGGHSTVTNTSRYTAVYAGWYVVGGGISYSGNATGVRLTNWGVNGSTLAGTGTSFVGSTAASNRLPARWHRIFLNVGDYIQLFSFQNSGGALNSAVVGVEQPSFNLAWDSN